MKQAKPDSGKSTGKPAAAKGPKVQGEGDYESAREYNKDLKDFMESGKVDEAARAAAPRSDKEAQDMERAEQAGKNRAKEEDPLLHKRKH